MAAPNTPPHPAGREPANPHPTGRITVRILDALLDPAPARVAPANRLVSGSARWADRHHPHRATLRDYYRRADALYMDRRPDNFDQMGRQVARLDAVREPLARAARALRAELGADYLLMSDELTDLWDHPGVVKVLPSGEFYYEIDYAAHLVGCNVEEMQDAADRDPAVARVLTNHLDRPK